MLNFALVNRMTQFFVWLSRIHRCRGFGIQSPTDYSFVRDIVNEHYPYYAYSELGQKGTWLDRKVGQLFLRLANHLQPNTIVDLAGGYDNYLKAGCRHAIITHDVDKTKGTSLIITSAGKMTDSLKAVCRPGSMLVIENISKNKSQWQEVVQWPQTTITFDLYYLGIATFDPARTPQHYTVNF